MVIWRSKIKITNYQSPLFAIIGVGLYIHIFFIMVVNVDVLGATFSKAFAVVTPRWFKLERHLLFDACAKVFCANSLTWGMIYGL